MPRRTIGRAAIASLALAAGTIACTPDADGSHVASAGAIGRDGAGEAAKLAAKAQAALTRHKPDAAIRFAERAVAADPHAGANRLLLGRAYLAAGRFASAEASFRDALTLSPGDPRATLPLALAETAQGRSADARALLATLPDNARTGDLGLAWALAGDRTRAIELLSAQVRAGTSDPRSRQNLALALALDGRWREARGTAMQDVGPDRIDDQLGRWAALAASNDPKMQVAALVGAVPAVADPGRPAALALADAPAAQFAAAPPIVDIPAPLAEMAVLALPAPVLASAPVPAPAMPVREAALAPVVAEPAPEVPAMIAAPRQRSFVRVAVRKPVSPGRILTARADGGWVVQLGAFRRTAIEAAWGKVSRASPRLAGFSPVSGRTSLSGAALVRLSVSGFTDRRAAVRLCEQVKLRGGACFVRASGNDTPWRWARRDAGTQVAMAGTPRTS